MPDPWRWPRPDTDPTALYRERDGVYASDLLIAAVADLDLFTSLAADPCDLDDLCTRFGVTLRPVDVMCTLLRALGLIEDREGTLHVTPLAREHLVEGSPFDLRPYFSSLVERPAVQELLQVLRTDEPAAWASAPGQTAWAPRLDDRDFAARITAAMDARGAYLAPALADAVDTEGLGAVLDVAGGSGIYACAFAARHAHLRAAVLERSPVDSVARDMVNRRGYSHRVGVVTGDMFTYPLPSGFDLHLYSHVLHDWDEARVRALLSASYAALPAGGAIVDHDVHVNADKTGPLPAARYSVLLMHSTAGKCWSLGELSEMMTEIGFVDVVTFPTADDRSAVRATKPG